MGRNGGQRGRSNPRSNNNKNDNKNNIEMKFVPHYSGKQLSHTYDTVKDHIVLQIQKNFRYGQDMATALRNMKYKQDPGGSKPTRKMVKTTEIVKCT